MKIFIRVKWALLLTVGITLAVVGVAFATTIDVDGDPSDWPGNPSCTPGVAGCALVLTDPQDLTPPNDPYDIEQVWVTNSASRLYLRLDTYAYPGTWTASASWPLLYICIDSDNNDATGSTAPVGFCNFNNTMLGVDHVITVIGDVYVEQEPAISYFRDCSGSWPCTPNTAKRARTSVGYANDHITEFGIDLADIGISVANCDPGCDVEMGLYFDNGASSNEDSIPDTPPYMLPRIGGDSPTAITLSNIEARNHTVWVFAAPIALIGLVAGAAAFTYKHRQV